MSIHEPKGPNVGSTCGVLSWSISIPCSLSGCLLVLPKPPYLWGLLGRLRARLAASNARILAECQKPGILRLELRKETPSERPAPRWGSRGMGAVSQPQTVKSLLERADEE